MTTAKRRVVRVMSVCHRSWSVTRLLPGSTRLWNGRSAHEGSLPASCVTRIFFGTAKRLPIASITRDQTFSSRPLTGTPPLCAAQRREGHEHIPLVGFLVHLGSMIPAFELMQLVRLPLASERVSSCRPK